MKRFNGTSVLYAATAVIWFINAAVNDQPAFYGVGAMFLALSAAQGMNRS